MALFISKTIFGKTDVTNPYFVIAKHNKNDVKIETKRELEQFYNVYGLKYIEFPNTKWHNVAKTLGVINPKWELMMPAEEYESLLVSYITDLITQLKEKTIDKFWYYGNIIPQESRLLESFQTVCYADGTEGSPYTYKRTAVGRLVSEHGINLFLMNQDRREQILESRFPKGKIVSIDFRALEPRVMLAIQNPGVLEDCDDVYSKVAEHISVDISREVVKLCLLKILNNSSINGIREGTSLSQAEAVELKNHVHHLFRYENKLVELEKQHNEKGRIYNYFGRPHELENNNINLFFTYFMQSTSADVCIIVFSRIVRLIETLKLSKKIVPIGMIYDSLILDVNESEFELIEKIISKCNTIKLGNEKFLFPMSINFWKTE